MNDDRRRWVSLYVLCTGMLMIVLDTTIVNVALPFIQNSLHFSASGLAWVVNAYLIAFGGLLLLAGRLGDLYGRRRMYLSGLVVFTVASLVCGLSQSQTMLVIARFAQGVGGAMTSAVILGMIVTTFPEPRLQARAIGVFAFVASAGGAVGLLAGGLLVQWVDWHWIFFVNLPIGVATWLASARLLEHDERPERRGRADVIGAVLVTAALMLGVYAIVDPAAAHGWTAPETLGCAAGAVVLLVAFVARQLTATEPLMPLRSLWSRNLIGANVIQTVGAAGMFGSFFLGALYLQKVLHYDPLQIGLAFLPDTLLMGVLSVRFCEPLVSRFGARTVMVPGLVLVAGGLALFAVAPVHADFAVDLLPAVVVMGVGAGLTFPSMMTLAMSGVGPAEAGLASGLINTTGQVGGAVGLAVLATAASGHTARLAESGVGTLSALTGGYHLAFWIAAGLAIAAVVVALVVVPGTVPQPVSAHADEEPDEPIVAAV